MKIERTKNTARNIVWGIINKVVTIAIPFITRTFIIWNLGPKYVGLGSLFNSVFLVLGLVEMGFSSAIVYHMYKPIAENDEEKVCALLNTARKVNIVLGFIVLLIGLAFVPFLKVIINDVPPADVNIYVLYGIYLASTLVGYFTTAYRETLILATQRNDIYENISTIPALTIAVLQVVILFVFKDYTLYTLGMFFTNSFVCVLKYVYTKKLYPQFVPKGTISKEEQLSIKDNIKGLAAFKISDKSRNAFDSIVVSMFLGLVAVGLYNNYYLIMSSVMLLIAVFSSAVEGGLGNSVAIDTPEKNFEDMQKVNFLFMWIAGWFTACFFVLVQPFMQIWMGDQYMLPMSSVIMFSLYFFVVQATGIPGKYISVTGLWWKCGKAYLIEALGNILLNFLLGYYFGINGVIAATIITILIFHIPCVLSILNREYFKNEKTGETVKTYIAVFLATIAASALTWFVTRGIAIGGDNTGGRILTMIIKGVICCILPNIILFICLHRYGRFKVAMPWAIDKVKYMIKDKFSRN